MSKSSGVIVKNGEIMQNHNYVLETLVNMETSLNKPIVSPCDAL